MRNMSTCHKFLHQLVFLLWFKITIISTLFGYQDGEGAQCIDKERHALLSFKAYIRNDPYDILSSWTKASNDCCEWSGVTCNIHSHVTTLGLSGEGLEGKISPSLLNLTYLNDLFLNANSFSGTIPVFIGSMTQLNYLDLSGNQFSGTIPVFIGSMTQLRSLHLSYNQFSGTIPVFIGSMTQLRSLDLSGNQFTGTIPSEFGNLTNLQQLSLESLSSCTIESLDWLSHLSQLENLYMSGTSLAKVNNWVNVILSLQNLNVLYLSDCNLSHVMHPYSYSLNNSFFSSSIVNLFLDNNNLNSSMYHWLFPLTSSNTLVTLDLSGNKLDRIPKYLGNLCNLRNLLCYNNSMPVKFADFLKNLSGCASVTLTWLGASSSRFTGSLSDDIQSFSSLGYLNLSNNQLNGTISEKVWELPYLDELDLSSNSLKGAISGYIGKSNIQSLDLSNNSLEEVPSVLSNLSKVESIVLSSNNFYGHIPNVSSTVVVLDLSKNKFFGTLYVLCQIVDGSLQLLDLSDNSLTGEIPDCFWHFKDLRILSLGQNNLTGRLPASMKSLINLEALYLYNNSFSGEFPVFLKNCIGLTFLELGANNFSGYIPIWIGEKLSRLYALSLSSNNFFGMIPLQLCQLGNLTILDFSMNNLYGTIPSCLNNLTSIVQGGFSTLQNAHHSILLSGWTTGGKYVDHAIIKWLGDAREFSKTLGLVKAIDLSSNNLTGNIPYELTDLHELISLNLSMNSLFGEIPQEIGLMKNLLQLDLSRNNLSGHIPTSMSQMTSLNYLDVSYNNLSGRIPSSTQLQSFKPSRYSGNEGLCGPPLTKYCPGDKELEVPSVIGQSEDRREGRDELERWFYIGGATSFPIGFWIVCGVLLLYSRGRHAFFRFMNSLESWVYVKVMVFFTKCQRVAHA